MLRCPYTRQQRTETLTSARLSSTATPTPTRRTRCAVGTTVRPDTSQSQSSRELGPSALPGTRPHWFAGLPSTRPPGTATPPPAPSSSTAAPTPTRPSFPRCGVCQPGPPSPSFPCEEMWKRDAALALVTDLVDTRERELEPVYRLSQSVKSENLTIIA